MREYIKFSIKYLNERSRWDGEGDGGQKKEKEKDRHTEREGFIVHKYMGALVWKMQEGRGVKRPPVAIGRKAQQPP